MKDDQFDFTRHKGFTESTATGPKSDHTKGTTSGLLALQIIPFFSLFFVLHQTSMVSISNFVFL